MTALTRPPLSLYIHTPWCVRKCPYCDFNSHGLSGEPPEQAYRAALLEDLQADLPLVAGRPVETVFFGGGTPSLLSPTFYRELLTELGRHLNLAPNAEITLEANPGTTDSARFEGFREAGINRLSLGIQSFDPAQLEKLGRIHGPKDSHRAIQQARSAGFTRLNLDLMFALPGQTVDQGLADLEAALAHQPDHLSWYQLTIEPNTAFYSRPPANLPGEEEALALYEAGRERLGQAGLRDYEVSAWAAPGAECRHNLNYWRFGDYLALGAGAHGKLTDREGDRVLRYWKTRQPEAYLSRIGSRTAGRQWIEREDRALEFLMNALRLRDGVSVQWFEACTGLPASALEPELSQLRGEGLLATDRLAATAQGRLYLDSLLERFL